ncbi:MAG: radical SAM protein [Desulforegulaceae bacterium]|nr:radical SAM protein [Desulforegulaceae bacterium]
MYKYVFGPVPSRRLGVSLGVDLVTHKTCSLDCVYCECGKTTILTAERKEYVPVNEVKKELEDYFKKNSKPDFVTFSGSGEPCLNIKIGEILDFIKANFNVKVCVLTNGTLFENKELRKDLLNADLVMPSLDSADKNSFLKINRPVKEIKVENYIKGLSDFKKEFKNRLELEIFILPDFNDSKEDILKLKSAVKQINPDLVLLNTLDRPGAIKDLRPASEAELLKFKKELGFENTQIISKSIQRKNITSYRKDREEAIYGMIFRRPCTIDDLTEILGLHRNDIGKYLDVLVSQGQVEVEELERGVFYKIKKTNEISVN